MNGQAKTKKGLGSAPSVTAVGGIDQEKKKICTKCKKEKPLDEFHKNKNQKDGRMSRCKQCKHEMYVENYEANKEMYSINNKRWHENNKEKHTAMNLEWRKNNNDKSRGYWLKWASKPENREHNIERALIDRKINADRIYISNKAWRVANPEKPRQYVQKRRALKKETIVEEINVLEIFERDKWICQICNQAVDKELSYPNPGAASLDHIVPLSIGGTHTKDNVQLAHLTCNLRASNLKKDKKLLQRISAVPKWWVEAID